MTAVLTIAGYGLREAVRRKVFVVVCFLSIAFLGLGAYRQAFGRPGATIGRQPEPFEGAQIWVLPNPSGLNANYQLTQFAELFRALRRSSVIEHFAALKSGGVGGISSRRGRPRHPDQPG